MLELVSQFKYIIVPFCLWFGIQFFKFIYDNEKAEDNSSAFFTVQQQTAYSRL